MQLRAGLPWQPIHQSQRWPWGPHGHCPALGGLCQPLLSPHTLHSPCAHCTCWGGCSVHGLSSQGTARAGDECPAEWHLHDPVHRHSVWGSQCLQLPAVLRAGVLWDGVTSPIQLTLRKECLPSHHLEKKHPPTPKHLNKLSGLCTARYPTA